MKKLKDLSDEFISEILTLYDKEEGNELNEKLRKLFETFNDDTNQYNVLIKVAALNKIYSTAITNINPVVKKIIEVTKENNAIVELNDYVNFVDEISKVKWTNDKGLTFERNNLSFASKYVHFLSGFQTPIYDSYIWIVIKGYLEQSGGNKISFKTPKDFKEFYLTFDKFKKELKLEHFSNYDIDKFLWQYGKQMIREIESELNIDLEKSKSELKKRLEKYRVTQI